MATNKKPTMLRLPENIFDKIRELAYRERRSMNMEIEHALQVYIAAYEKENGPIQLPTPAEEE